METQAQIQTQAQMRTQTQSIEKLIYDETERRLNLMEQKDYEFPTRITNGDVWAIIGSIAVSLFLIILCMIGVIQ